jgi:phage terminase small subunit
MAKGQHPIPKRLKLAPGRPSARPAGAVEPTPSTILPTPAEWLPKGALPIFHKLVAKLSAMGYASDSHAEMLNVLALRLYQVEKYTGMLEEIDHSGMEAVRLSNMLNLAAKHAQHLSVEFGLTPASSTRIAVPARGEGNRFSEFGPKRAA